MILCLSTGCQRVDRPLEPPHEIQKELRKARNSHQTHDHSPEDLKIPEDVVDDIFVGITNDPAVLKPKVQRFDVTAENVDIRSLLNSLMQSAPYSVAIHPDVQGAISLQLKNVTLDETLDILSSLYGYDIQQKGRVYQIYPAGMQTRSFQVNYLFMQRAGTSSITVNSGGVSQQAGASGGGNSSGSSSSGSSNSSSSSSNSSGSSGSSGSSSSQQNGSFIETISETTFWSELKETLQTMIGTTDGRYVVVSPQSGLVTVRALPGELRTVEQFLSISEQTIQRQVILETKVIEVTLDDEYQQGINWQKALSHLRNTDFSFVNSPGKAGNTITGGLGGITGLTVTNQNFQTVIELMQTQGNVHVLSSPRVSASNNQKAVIKVGQDEYFVTDVSTTTVTGTTNSGTSTTPDIELTPFFSGISLDVTPQIDLDGNVILHVHPAVNETTEQKKTITLNNENIVLPLAQSNIRESDTVIRAKSGEIVIIGGLMQNLKTYNVSKTPLLGDIPFIGELFTSRFEKNLKKELVILLKPVVVEGGTWREQLDRSKRLLEEWYQGE
ncbi:pilus (MSHA type) biogenesis protein MshL [Algicola sagamiensis]|uniref:pilus (MSHA type) biogenesis protein MshL n=1 Tax=Algicola sagamiensis TaxID=163869 RepID=UPI0003627DB1|nr:pilus (MSHA type) biogenesis protein MshL [Algicola sagamiensis]